MIDVELDSALNALAIVRALHNDDKRGAAGVLSTLSVEEGVRVVGALAGMLLSYIGTEAEGLGITVDDYLDRLPALLEGEAS